MLEIRAAGWRQVNALTNQISIIRVHARSRRVATSRRADIDAESQDRKVAGNLHECLTNCLKPCSYADNEITSRLRYIVFQQRGRKTNIFVQ